MTGILSRNEILHPKLDVEVRGRNGFCDGHEGGGWRTNARRMVWVWKMSYVY